MTIYMTIYTIVENEKTVFVWVWSNHFLIALVSRSIKNDSFVERVYIKIKWLNMFVSSFSQGSFNNYLVYITNSV